MRSLVHGSRETPHSIIKRSLGVAILVLIGISGWSTGLIPFLQSVHAQGVAEVGISPSSVASLTDLPGSTVTFQVNTTDASPFAGFYVGFFYNISVLKNPQVDYSNNVLDAPGNPATVVSECVNGLSVFGSGNVCHQDISFDGVGVVSLQLLTTPPFGNTATPNGKLFSVTFTVGAKGFSPVHFVKALLGVEPNSNFLPVVTHDGYFTNMDCPSGSGILCRPPIVSLSAPQVAFSGNSAIFDASGSMSQDPNGTITQYAWIFASGLNRHFQTTTSPLTTFIFPSYAVGVWTVTLAVQDNYGALAVRTLLVNVKRLQVSTSMFFTDGDLNYLHTFLDKFGFVTPEVNVTISNGVVRNVNPRQVLEWLNLTNSGVVPLQSVRVNESLPVDWGISQALKPENSIHIYFANTSSLATNPEITQPFTIMVSTLLNYFGSPEAIQLAMPSLNETEIGHPLMPGQSILISVSLSYTLIGTSPPLGARYPYGYICEVLRLEAWPTTGFGPGESYQNPSLPRFWGFVAFATSVGHLRPKPTIV